MSEEEAPPFRRLRSQCDPGHCGNMKMLVCWAPWRAQMTRDGFYNDLLIDKRNERPLMAAFVASIAIWSVAALMALI